jgi:hypothetical protein
MVLAILDAARSLADAPSDSLGTDSRPPWERAPGLWRTGATGEWHWRWLKWVVAPVMGLVSIGRFGRAHAVKYAVMGHLGDML